MKKQTFMISSALDAVISSVKISLTGGNRTKERALRTLMQLARDDKVRFVDDGAFNGVTDKSCTVPLTDAEYDADMKYRDKHKLTTVKGYCLHILKHGATLWKKNRAAAEAEDQALDAQSSAA